MVSLTSMNRRRAFPALAVAVLVLLGPVRPSVAGAPIHEVADFVRGLGAETAALLENTSLSPAERHREIRKLLRAKVDLRRVGRFVLGRYWRSASPEQRATYLRLFEVYATASFAERLRTYAGERLEVGAAGLVDSNRAVVPSRLVRAEGAPVVVDWHLIRAAEGWRVLDVVVEGVSLALTQRSEFAAVIKSGGGRIDALLQKLRDKTATLTAALGD